MLSPRHLYYGARQRYWECPQEHQSADGVFPGNKTPGDRYDALSAVLYSGTLRQRQAGPCDHNAILDDYYTLVEEYSQRKLTFDSDKLPAFSGLVQRLYGALGGNCLAGLWSSDLVRSKQLVKTLAPADNVGVVYYDEPEERSNASLTRASLIPIYADNRPYLLSVGTYPIQQKPN